MSTQKNDVVYSCRFRPRLSFYGQKQAIEDGYLIEAEAIAALGGVDCPTPREAGIIFPVLLSVALFEQYVKPSKEAQEWGQSLNGRLWDVYWMFSVAARKCKEGDSFVAFEVIFQDGPATKDKHIVKIWGVCEPGDKGRPTITLMLPEDY